MLGVQCAESAVWKALNKMGFTFKKRRSMRQSKTDQMSLSVVPRGSETKSNPTPAD